MSEAIDLSIFFSRLESVCDEMGAILQNAAFSPNIKDRLDFSCAVFDVRGYLAAQAAHIPVHLGSMAYAMADIVDQIDWCDGDIIIVNDPFLGGTHLPDVTLISPVFIEGKVSAFVANRAHHANIGAEAPGSMPITSSLEQEGIVIAPTKLVEQGNLNKDLLARVCAGDKQEQHEASRANGTVNAGDINPLVAGDFYAQISANRVGVERLVAIIEAASMKASSIRGSSIQGSSIQCSKVSGFQSSLQALNQYAFDLADHSLSQIPDGEYYFEDVLDDDGLGTKNIKIALNLTIQQSQVYLDFSGSAKQVEGNVNCPLSVVAAAAFYCFRCLMPSYTPSCAGTFKAIHLKVPLGSLLNAQRPAAVAAGNVETSSRICDVVFGALAQALPNIIPAASQGSMNNIAMGARASSLNTKGSSSEAEGPSLNAKGSWDYYETLGGGSGGGPGGQGLSGRQTHMTNTLNTPVESIESHFPVRIKQYSLRPFSGGGGYYRGGNGIVREYQFLDDTEVSLITERRTTHPWGLHGGQPGARGANWLNGKVLPAKAQLNVTSGDTLRIETPGGGGWNPLAKTE